MKVQPFGPPDPGWYREPVRRALAEDLGWGDMTTEACVESDVRARITLVAGHRCVLAGLDIAYEVFRQLDPGAQMTRHRGDADLCEPDEPICDVEGRAAPLVTARRTALNFLRKLSGIATLTREFRDAAGDGLVVLDTRYTTPTLRALEQYAVRAGGGRNDRAALDEGVVIEQAHVLLAGSIAEAVRRVRAHVTATPVEVTARSLAEVEAALAAGVERVRVDAFSPDAIGRAVRLSAGRAQIVVCGPVTLGRLPALLRAGVRFISVEALTASAPPADLDFTFQPLG